MVQVARNLKKEHGVLPEVPMLSKGKVLSSETKKFVVDFFESEEISRQCPGLKDCKSVRDQDGNKVVKQKTCFREFERSLPEVQGVRKPP